MREEKLSFQDKIIKHHLTKIYRVILCVVLVIVIATSIHFYREGKVYTEYEVTKTYDSIGSKDSKVEVYNQNNILCYSRDGVSAYNAKGEQLWNRTFEMQSPIIRTSGEYVVAGDYKGNEIYLMNASGPCATITCNKIIVDVNVSQGGVVIATLDDSSVTWLELYASDGTSLATIRTTMDQTGFPVKLSMSPDNKKMMVSYLKARGNGIQTSLAFYNFGDVGQNMTDKIVSGYDYAEKVIPFLHYVDENTAVCVGEDVLQIYYGKQIPELKTQVEVEKDIQSVFYGEGYTVLVYRNEESEDKYRADIYDLNAKLVLTKTFNMEYDNIVISNKNILIYNSAEVLMWNLKGLEKYNGELGTDIKAIIPTKNEMKFIVVRDDGVETVKLK